MVRAPVARRGARGESWGGDINLPQREKRPQLHRFGRGRVRSKALIHAHRVSTFGAANEAFYGQLWILRAHLAMSVF